MSKNITMKKRTLSFLVVAIVAILAVGFISMQFLATEPKEGSQSSNGEVGSESEEVSILEDFSDDQEVASVNDEVITAGEVREQYSAIGPEQQANVDETQILEQLVQTKLLLEEAEESGIEFTEEEVKQEIESELETQGMTMEDLEKQLEAQGQSLDDAMEQYESSIIIEEYLDEEMGDVNVSDEEVEQYYEMLKQQGGENETPP